jgi:hypothetical protein
LKKEDQSPWCATVPTFAVVLRLVIYQVNFPVGIYGRGVFGFSPLSRAILTHHPFLFSFSFDRNWNLMNSLLT